MRRRGRPGMRRIGIGNRCFGAALSTAAGQGGGIISDALQSSRRRLHMHARAWRRGLTMRVRQCGGVLVGWMMATAVGFAAIPPPPVASVEPVVEDYFGTQVTDNYRWME